jgi:hypothetical protein
VLYDPFADHFQRAILFPLDLSLIYHRTSGILRLAVKVLFYANNTVARFICPILHNFGVFILCRDDWAILVHGDTRCEGEGKGWVLGRNLLNIGSSIG